MSNRIGSRKLGKQIEKKISPTVARNLHRIAPNYANTKRQQLLWAIRNPDLVTAELVKLRLRGEEV